MEILQNCVVAKNFSWNIVGYSASTGSARAMNISVTYYKKFFFVKLLLGKKHVIIVP